jgi:hypothetical protein
VVSIFVVKAVIAVSVNVLEFWPRPVGRPVLASSVAWLIPGGCSLYHDAEASVVEAVGGGGGGMLGFRQVIVVDGAMEWLTGSGWQVARVRDTARARAQQAPTAVEGVGSWPLMAGGRAGIDTATVFLPTTRALAAGGAIAVSPQMPGWWPASFSFSFMSQPRRRHVRSGLRRRPGASEALLTSTVLPAAAAAARAAAGVG